MKKISKNIEFHPMFRRSKAHQYKFKALCFVVLFTGLSLIARYLYISTSDYKVESYQIEFIRQPRALHDLSRNAPSRKIIERNLSRTTKSIKSEARLRVLHENVTNIGLLPDFTSIKHTDVTTKPTYSLPHKTLKEDQLLDENGYIPAKTLINSLMQSFNDCSHNASLRKNRNYKLGTIERDNFTEFCLSKGDDISKYTELYNGGSDRCYTVGTKGFDSGRGCLCREGWTGEWCSLPPTVTLSDYPQHFELALRAKSRRIIYIFPFSQEFDLLWKRLHDYKNSVDFYVIVESNFTSHGDPKPRYLRDRLLENNDYLSDFGSKIIIAELNQFPKQGLIHGWIAEELARTFAMVGGIARIRGIKSDDILISTDADEVPSCETLNFLKHHEGFPEPIGFRLKSYVFSRRWLYPSLTHIIGACTFGMMRHVFEGNLYALRNVKVHSRNMEYVQKFQEKFGGRVFDWSFGTVKTSTKFEKLENQEIRKDGVKELKILNSSLTFGLKANSFGNRESLSKNQSSDSVTVSSYNIGSHARLSQSNIEIERKESAERVEMTNSGHVLVNTQSTLSEMKQLKSKNTTFEQDQVNIIPSGQNLNGLAGYHCSWCFNATGVLWKLHASQVDDPPRWGDIIGKDDVSCVNYHIMNGVWFDNKTKLIPAY